MKHKAEKYARDQAVRMRQSGFSHYKSERVRSYIENAYQYGYRAGRAKSPITEDVIMRGGIAEDIILKSAAQ